MRVPQAMVGVFCGADSCSGAPTSVPFKKMRGTKACATAGIAANAATIASSGTRRRNFFRLMVTFPFLVSQDPVGPLRPAEKPTGFLGRHQRGARAFRGYSSAPLPCPGNDSRENRLVGYDCHLLRWLSSKPGPLPLLLKTAERRTLPP